VLAHPEIVAIHDPAQLARPAGWEQRFTTWRLIALETEIADAIASGVASHTGALAPEAVAVACTVASLGTDQHDAVTRLCTQSKLEPFSLELSSVAFCCKSPAEQGCSRTARQKATLGNTGRCTPD
jgi:hypothetical protein